MFAIIKTGGKQYRVAKDDVINVGKLSGNAGDKITLGDVLALGGDKPVFGAPLVKGASVLAEIGFLTNGTDEALLRMSVEAPIALDPREFDAGPDEREGHARVGRACAGQRYEWGAVTAPQMFRWKFSDGFDDNQWTDWHPVTGACTVCCCGGGPGEDGEHQAPAEYYEDGFLENAGTPTAIRTTRNRCLRLSFSRDRLRSSRRYPRSPSDDRF